MIIKHKNSVLIQRKVQQKANNPIAIPAIFSILSKCFQSYRILLKILNKKHFKIQMRTHPEKVRL